MFLAEQMFLGEDLLPWLVLALGAALAVGNLLAILRPRTTDDIAAAGPAAGEDDEDREADADLARAPVARSLVMAAIGLVAAVWAIASLTS